MKSRGFTMVELVMTIVVIGVLAVYAIPRFDLLRGFDEVGYRDKVKATLEFARKAAVAQRRYVCVALANDDLILTIYNAAPETSANACPAGTGLAHDLSLPTPDSRCGSAPNMICNPSGVTLTGTPTTFSISPLGRFSSGVAYTIGQSTLPITVEAETGYVH